MTRIALVVNAAKADGEQAQALCSQVAAVCAEAGWPAPDLRSTSPDDPGTAAAQAAIAAGADLVVACGGDGTVNAVAQALAGTGVRLGIVPLGTGNLLAANLGIPTDPGAAIRVLTDGADRRIDLGRTGERVFAGIAGLGLDAAMVAGVSAILKKRLGWPAYIVPIVRHLPDRGVTLTLDLDGRRVRHYGVRTLLIGNIGRVHGGLDLLPGADPADGVLDVVLLAPRGLLLGWISVVIHLARRSDHTPDTITRYRARRIVVRTRHAVEQELDGEPYRCAAELEVEVLEGALYIRVPADRLGETTADTAAESAAL